MDACDLRTASQEGALKLMRRLRPLVERVTGAHFYLRLPRGIDQFSDIEVFLPRCRLDVIFDVGANTGQSARKYVNRFPASRVFCFEPGRESFRRLQAAFAGCDNVRAFRLALGAESGRQRLVHAGSPTEYFVADASYRAHAQSPGDWEDVDMTTLDRFCADRGIAHIDYLKIDTEGCDLQVLRGARLLLEQQGVDLVEVEAGMNPDNSVHVPFRDLQAQLEEHGYRIFGVYEQRNEYPTQEPHLRRTNPVFISPRVIRENSG